jgi:streptogramin lyase
VLFIAGCGSSDGNSAGEGTGAASTGHTSSPPRATGSVGPRYVVTRIPTGSKPCATLGAAGSIWVADINDATVKRLDPATGRLLATITTAAGPCGMAYGAGSIWVEDYTASAVTRIDVATNRTSTIKVGSSPYDVTFAAGAAWVTNNSDGTVTRIEARTNKTHTIQVGATPAGIAAARGAIWVCDTGSSELTRIDAVTTRVTTIPFGGSPSWTAYDQDTVWIGDQRAGEIVRLDARSGRIVRRVKVGPTPNDGDVFDGGVWFPDKDGSLYRLDQRTDAVTGPFPTGAGNPFVLSGYDRRLWIADYAGTDTIVVDPALVP